MEVYCKHKAVYLGGNRSSYCGGVWVIQSIGVGDGNLPWGSKQQGMVWGCLRGASWCLIGGEQASRGGGKVGGDEEGNPLPKDQGGVVGVWRERPLPLLLLAGLVGVDGSVGVVGRKRPLPIPLHDERPPSPGTKVFKAWALPCGGPTSCLVVHLLSLKILMPKFGGALPALPLPLFLSFSK